MKFTAQLASFAALTSLASAQITFNEIRIDQPGGDTDEYVELLGPPGMSLDGLSYVVIGDSGSGITANGRLDMAFDLTGNSINANGFFTIAETNATLGGTIDLTDNVLSFENGDNVTHLIVAGNTAAVGDDLDTDDDGILDITPWTSIIDCVALIEEANPPSGTEFEYATSLGYPTVGPDGNFVPGHVFFCGGSDWRMGTFALSGIDSPGAANSCPALQVAFCDAIANSFSTDGSYVTLDSASGGSIAANDASLVVVDSPDGQFGLFAQSMSEIPPMMATFGGNICLGDPIQRINFPIIPVGNTASYALDFVNGGAEVGTMPGVTMYYQWFHRDTIGGGGNFSEGLAITWLN